MILHPLLIQKFIKIKFKKNLMMNYLLICYAR